MARSLFEAGKAHRDHGDWAAALESFKRADALVGAPTTRLAVARAYAGLGKLVEARDRARSVVEIPRAAGESRPFADARVAANALANEVDERIPSLVLTVRAPQGEANVAIDGVSVGRTATSSTQHLNPGQHVVVGKCGHREVRETVFLRERETTTVTIDCPRTDAPHLEPDAPPVAATTSPEPSLKPQSFPIVPWVITGGLAVATATAGMFSARAYASYETARSAYPTTPELLVQTQSSARELVLLTSVLGAATAVSAAVAVYFTVARTSPRTGRGGAVRVVAGLGGAAIQAELP
jgi:hypothetical protein